MRQAWLIYNPTAGRFPAGWLLSRAVRVLSNAGWEVRVQEAQEGQDLAELARRAVESQCEAIFVAGGDGTVGTVAGALAGTHAALGVLPSGTANVWAKEIGLDRLDWINIFALEKAAERLAQAEVRLVDIGTGNGHEFLLWSGMGLDARIVNSIEPRLRWEKTLGTVHSALLALWNSIGWEGIDLRVTAGGRSWEGRYVVAVASNIRMYAGGLMELAPDARFDDGQLDFWLIGGRSLMDAVLRVVQILRGTHVDAPGVVHFQASEAQFESDADLTVQFDGEPTVVSSPLCFETRRKVLRMLMPTPEPSSHIPTLPSGRDA
jgi:YegS/Rv2252/BmrU family lipid kinase